MPIFTHFGLALLTLLGRLAGSTAASQLETILESDRPINWSFTRVRADSANTWFNSDSTVVRETFFTKIITDMYYV